MMRLILDCWPRPQFAACIALVLTAVSLGVLSAQDDTPGAANSTRKIRVRPGPLASKIGTGVAWESSLDAALNKSVESGRPVFWYIPSVPETFMDRKVEIDRYMMAGPFSWRAVRAILDHHFVAVKAVPTRQEQERFGLVRYDFVEPGCLILSSDGEVLKRMDRLTTLHPTWWLAALKPFAREDVPPIQSRPEIAAAWQRVAHRDLGTNMSSAPNDWPIPDRVEWEWLRGVMLFRSGKHEQATDVWRAASEQFPDDPLAWKLAAEAEGFGPFVRGFEVYDVLPEQLLQAAASERALTSAAPAQIYPEPEVWERSVSYLLAMQRSDGGWRDSDYDFGGTDSLPNVHVAVSALCGLALIEAEKKLPHRAAEIQAAVEQAIRFVNEASNYNRSDRDELTWALAYRVQFLAQACVTRPTLRADLQSAVRDLEQFQSPAGGWFHEYRNPFVSGTALVALAHARDAGAAIDEAQLNKGLQSLRGERMGNGAFPYSSGRGGGGAREGRLVDIQASVGRMPICELALWHWGASEQDLLEASVARSLEYHALLQKALKYDDHTDHMAYGGFFFWYGVYGRGLAIALLTDAPRRTAFARQQRELILALPEIDGCFVDSHELGRCYGTAMALLSLALCP